MTLDDSILGVRLRVMRRAQDLGNVSQICPAAYSITRSALSRAADFMQ